MRRSRKTTERPTPPQGKVEVEMFIAVLAVGERGSSMRSHFRIVLRFSAGEPPR